jgi:Effector-associated domain 11
MKIETLKKWIAAGDTKTCLEQIMIALQFNRAEAKDFILLNSRYVANESLYRANVLDINDYQLECNRIKDALLSCLDEVSDSDLFSEKETTVSDAKLLFLAANPKSAPQLKLAEEYLDIKKSLKRKPVTVQVVEEFDVTLTSFFKEIQLERPSIVQFAGNGDTAQLILCNPDGEGYDSVSWRFLLPAFDLASDFVECVFIHSVDSAAFARALSKFIPFVIGVEGMVLDEDAIQFSPVFYSTLSYEKNYILAFETAKTAIESRLAERKAKVQVVDYQGNLSWDTATGVYGLYINGELHHKA